MNELVKADLKEKIVVSLLFGEKPEEIAIKHDCDLKHVFRVLRDKNFQERISEYLEKEIKINGLAALRNIKEIADDEQANKNTRLRASQWIAEKALEINNITGSDGSASTMSQDQLARRLQELQKEAVKRSKPIDTGVLDQQLESMFD